jgi:hypothetical protein
MKFKRIFDSLTGKTTSSNVLIIENTHFFGDHFRRVIDIEDSSENLRKKAQELDKLFPEHTPRKHDTSLWYRATFRLDLNKRPSNMKLSSLIHNSKSDKYYSAFTEVLKTWPLRILGSDDDGYRTRYIGYKLCDWLEIETEHVIEGSTSRFLGNDIRIFEVSYTSIGEFHEGDNKRRFIQDIHIIDSETNKFIRGIVKSEASIFLRQCAKMMSPS